MTVAVEPIHCRHHALPRVADHLHRQWPVERKRVVQPHDRVDERVIGKTATFGAG